MPNDTYFAALFRNARAALHVNMQQIEERKFL